MNEARIDFVNAGESKAGPELLLTNVLDTRGRAVSAMLRGGRMTKHKGEAASYSPELGVAALVTPVTPQGSVFAMAAAALRWSTAPIAILASGLAFAAPAAAQDQCAPTGPGGDIFICADNGAPATTPQVINGVDVEVRIEDGFAVDTTGNGGNALTVTATNSLFLQQIAGMSSLTGDEGIIAENLGGGELSLTTGGPVTGRTARGIYARQHGSGTDVIIDTSAGPVTGASDGIRARNQGSGSLSITTADVTGMTGIGISANQEGPGTSLTVDTTAGSVIGGLGIYLIHEGRGPLTLSTSDVTGRLDSGISVSNFYGGSTTIDTTSGTVTGGLYGIELRHYGATAVSITTGDVNALGINAQRGIDVISGGTDLTIDTSGGAVRGRQDGIRAYSSGAAFGSGDLSITTGDVSGELGTGITALQRTVGLDLIIDTSAGTVTGGTDGIFAQNLGTGALSITTGDVTGTNGRGLSASQSANGENVTIDTSAGTVTGGTDGIFARNYGYGALTITAADVTGMTGNGIDAEIRAANSYNPNTGTDLTIDTTAGTVTGANSGILARSDGRGALTITTGDVTGTGRNGIDARSQSTGTDLTINTSAGSVSGDTTGIFARNDGIGALSITTADVTGTRQNGIDAVNDGTDLTIDSSAGSVSGDEIGISARNFGRGALLITTADVTGASDNGIDAVNDGTDLTIDSGAGSVIGDEIGISARNFGGGALLITTADVTGTSLEGIYAANDGTDLTINTSAGSVSGGRTGIFSRNNGSGALSITTGDVTGNTGRGIYAFQGTSGTDLIIDSSAGAVTGAINGITAINNGTGALAITTSDVTATSGSGLAGRGISATNLSQGTDITIDTSAGTVSGRTDGIFSRNNGSGALSITTGNVTGTTRHGVWAELYAGGTSLTIDTSAGSVTGGAFGIVASHYGSGPLSITTGDVTGMSGSGISASKFLGGDFTIDTTAGTVTGSNDGINARMYGYGALSITTGDVNALGSSGRRGIDVSSSGTELTIDTTAGAVRAAFDGIRALSYSSGVVSITTGDVSGRFGSGIFARQYSRGTDLIIDSSAGVVSGYVTGIYARNQGTGALSITTGDVTSNMNAMRSAGINANNSGTDVTIDTSAGMVSGGYFGIYLTNQGSGEVSITTSDVTGRVFAGVSVQNDGTNVTIDTTAGTVTGGMNGIYARNNGSGALSITTADATGTSERGINAINSAAGTGLTIDSRAGTLTGGLNGIFAYNYGNGALSITTEDVIGTTRRGLDAFLSPNGTSFTLDTTAGMVTGGTDGIYARSYGSGALTITTGDVTGMAGSGVEAVNFGTDLIIDTSAGTVTGGMNGIYALNLGSGLLSITTGDVTGMTDQGIRASNRDTGTDLTIDSSAGTVIGETDGIYARNEGTGALSITTGDVIANSGRGIFGIQDEDGTSLTIDTSAGAVTGQTFGIDAWSYGSGALSITAGDVTGATSRGINAFNSNFGTDLTVNTSAGAVTGQTDGIFARNIGTGALTITTADVTGNTRVGIDARQYAGGTDLTIDSSAGAVTGASDGIDARNSGTGALSISTGDVTGTSGRGIYALQQANGTDLIIDSSAGVVSGATTGIFARNLGSGELFITSGDVTGSFLGIEAINLGTDLTLDSSAGAVSGGNTGINARNAGTGALTLTTADVTGGTRGIFTSNSGNGTDLTVDTTAGAVTGGSYGIEALNDGRGALTITTADVTANTGQAIRARQNERGTGLTIDTRAGAIIGETAGINARNYSTGALTITTGDVTANTGRAIDAYQAAAGTDLTIDTRAGSITGGTVGINARNYSTGALTITTGDVTANLGRAIDAYQAAAGTDLTIDTRAGAIIS